MKCRCPDCTAAKTAYDREYIENNRDRLWAIGSLKHGTVSGYTNGRCRCDDCRQAQRIYTTEYRARVGRKPANRLQRAGRGPRNIGVGQTGPTITVN